MTETPTVGSPVATHPAAGDLPAWRDLNGNGVMDPYEDPRLSVEERVAEPQRVRAVAFRMEGLHGRWRVTELEMQGRLEE